MTTLEKKEEKKPLTDAGIRGLKPAGKGKRFEPPSPSVMAARRDALIVRGYPYLVAELGGEVVGFAYAGPYRPRPAYRSTVEGSVYVCVRTPKGVGRLLLAELIEEATRVGYRQMIAVIGDTENRASIKIHKAVGFALTGVLHSVGWKNGRWLDTVIIDVHLA